MGGWGLLAVIYHFVLFHFGLDERAVGGLSYTAIETIWRIEDSKNCWIKYFNRKMSKRSLKSFAIQTFSIFGLKNSN